MDARATEEYFKCWGKIGVPMMQRQICDINSHAPQFFVDDGVVYDPVENKPRFWIHDQYWIPYLSEDRWPLYVEEGKYVYAYPRDEGPVYYYR